MHIGRRLLGKTVFEKLMKATFYGQFVAGEDEVRIRPVVAFNRQFGVKSILDYSVEKDLTQEEARDAEMEWVSLSESVQPVHHNCLVEVMVLVQVTHYIILHTWFILVWSFWLPNFFSSNIVSVFL